MDKKIENIKFEYVKGVKQDDAREHNATRNINIWFEPFIKEINEQKAIITVSFDKDLDSLLFENISNDLREKLNDEFNRYRLQKY